MDIYIIISTAAAVSFISGFLSARYLYIKNFTKKISNYHKVNSSLNEKYYSAFKKNKTLEARIKLLQPNLISLESMFKKMIVSMN